MSMGAEGFPGNPDFLGGVAQEGRQLISNCPDLTFSPGECWRAVASGTIFQGIMCDGLFPLAPWLGYVFAYGSPPRFPISLGRIQSVSPRVNAVGNCGALI